MLVIYEEKQDYIDRDKNHLTYMLRKFNEFFIQFIHSLHKENCLSGREGRIKPFIRV